MTAGARYWAVVPAAGVGRRMGGAVPKQYLRLAGRTVLDHTLGRLLVHPWLSGVYLVLAEEDDWWPDSAFFGDLRVVRVTGGAQRYHSVLNALSAMARVAGDEDWVLVHDAARPCLHPEDLDRLIRTLGDHPVGGLLAVPIHDTVKRADSDLRVVATVPRQGLWRAYTPQMFRLSALGSALERALTSGAEVTDDASAMELAGHHPLLVEGRPDNIKITRPEDLELAAFFLAQQERSDAHRSRL